MAGSHSHCRTKSLVATCQINLPGSVRRQRGAIESCSQLKRIWTVAQNKLPGRGFRASWRIMRTDPVILFDEET